MGSTPLKHSYRRSWLHSASGRSAGSHLLSRHLSIEWDGINRLRVRQGKLWRSTTTWTRDELRGIVFGIRENKDAARKSATWQRDWIWFVHLTGKSSKSNGGAPETNVLAEFLVAHQHDAPTNVHALVPHRVRELLTWLEHCTGRRVHGPVLVTDESSRRRILSHVD